jgi:hypothetical protein
MKHLFETFASDMLNIINVKSKNNKAIPATGRGGLRGCEMLRTPHCLDNRFTDGDKIVSHTRRPPLYSPEILFFCFWYSFLLEAE